MTAVWILLGMAGGVVVTVLGLAVWVARNWRPFG